MGFLFNSEDLAILLDVTDKHYVAYLKYSLSARISIQDLIVI